MIFTHTQRESLVWKNIYMCRHRHKDDVHSNISPHTSKLSIVLQPRDQLNEYGFCPSLSTFRNPCPRTRKYSRKVILLDVYWVCCVICVTALGPCLWVREQKFPDKTDLVRQIRETTANTNPLLISCTLYVVMRTTTKQQYISCFCYVYMPWRQCQKLCTQVTTDINWAGDL